MATGAGWLVTGSRSLGLRLIEALVNGDEDSKTLAGTFLVRGGERGRQLAVAALKRGVEAPELVTVLQSIGGPLVEADLAELARAETGPMGGWARQALSELGEMRRRRGQEA